MSIVEAIEKSKWTPGIGDPSILGWATVGLYAFAAFFCIFVIFKQRRYEQLSKNYTGKLFWYAILFSMIFLGINKQLDLQTLLTSTFRVIARAEGWYEERKHYQTMFIGFIFASGVFSLIIMTIFIRKAFKLRVLALFGLITLVTFIVIRAASFHNADALLREKVGEHFKLYSVLEASGVSIIIVTLIINIIYYSKTNKELSKHRFKGFDDEADKTEDQNATEIEDLSPPLDNEDLSTPTETEHDFVNDEDSADDADDTDDADDAELESESLDIDNQEEIENSSNYNHNEETNNDFSNSSQSNEQRQNQDGPGFNVWTS